jgi:hypothetical protein
VTHRLRSPCSRHSRVPIVARPPSWSLSPGRDRRSGLDGTWTLRLGRAAGDRCSNWGHGSNHDPRVAPFKPGLRCGEDPKLLNEVCEAGGWGGSTEGRQAGSPHRPAWEVPRGGVACLASMTCSSQPPSESRGGKVNTAPPGEALHTLTLALSHTHKHIHIHTNPRSHGHSHTHTHKRTLTQLKTYTQMHTHVSHSHTHTHTTHSYTLTHTHDTHSHTHTQTHSCTFTRLRTHRHTHASHSHMHSHTAHKHMHKCTVTHIHTHTQPFVL